MKAVVLAIAMLSASVSFAKWTPILDTTSLTCQDAREAVIRNGFQDYTVNGQPVYPRTQSYYASESDASCAQWEIAIQAWVPTQDAKHCPVGFVCQDKSVLGGGLE